MKKILSTLNLKDFLIVLLIGFSVFGFTEKENKKPFFDGIEVIRVVDAAGLTGIFETTADILVVCDRATTIPAGTLPMPNNPINKQLFMVSTRVTITNLTLDPGPNAIPISGGITTLLAGTSKAWIYNEESNRWFPFWQ